MADTQQRKLRKTFEIIKRDPSDSDSAWDMKCLRCTFRSSGWDLRSLALKAGYAHATKDHAEGVLPVFSGYMREMLS